MFDIIFTSQDFFIDNIDELIETEKGAALNFLKSSKENRFKAIYDASFVPEPKAFGPGLRYIYSISETFVREIIKEPFVEFQKGHAEFQLSDELKERFLIKAPYTAGSENITEDWLQRFWSQILDIYNQETGEYSSSVASYINHKNNDLAVADKVYFHLVENSDEQYPFAFLATYSAPKKEGRKTFHTPLEYALQQYKNNTGKLIELLATVLKVAKESDFVNGFLETGEFFKAIGLTAEEATSFLKDVPLFEENGIICRVPNWWKKKDRGLSSGFVIAGSENSLNLNSLISFKPAVFLDGKRLTREELMSLLKQPEGLFRFKGQWVNIQRKHIEDLIQILDDHSMDTTYSISDLLSNQFKDDRGVRNETETLMQREFMYHFKKKIDHFSKKDQRKVPETLNATLRDYQIQGFKWLCSMEDMGFGYCLADDMGLGKTIQVLCLLESDRQQKRIPSLLVIPASLLSNWENELEKFLPYYSYKVLHSAAGEFDRDDFIEDDIPLYITTYGMVKKIPKLTEIRWNMVILDEAQAIKNPGTKQTKAIKELQSRTRLAMTGTPLENNPKDLWSLFDFLNPGILGNAKEFKAFAKELGKDESKVITLRKTVNPFILRRLKTDRRIIQDLPDKIEIKDYVDLTAKQAAAYTRVVDRLSKSIEEAEGIERRGMVLAAITSLKQICNHPSQYLGSPDFRIADSGKLSYLLEVSKTISEKHEKLLVFTQYAEIIPHLDQALSSVFGKKGLTLSGSTPIKKRGQIVEAFNDRDTYIPYVILSLKAGGTGLNLTGANHVIHFDRWWNPAVENQATDRAYRIGQSKNVIVRKLITRGTLEEKIDGIIDDKKKLAEDILGGAREKSITEMNDAELMSFLKLSI